MAFRPLKEHPDNEIWRWLTKKINDALDTVYGLATEIMGVKYSITKDDTDKKLQLVNDLSDAELVAQNKDLIYGWSKTSSARGWKEDWGGRIGSKEVDEVGLGDDVIPVYDEATGKYKLEPKPAVGRLNYFLIDYHLWRGEYEGNIHFQLQIGTSKDFSGTLDYNLDTATSQANWITFDGIKWANFLSTGMPTTYIQVARTGITFTTSDIRYIRWRSYYSDEDEQPVYGDWTGGII